MSELYPFASHYFERDGLRLHYLDEGSGPPVVMLHGNPTWSFFYRDLITALRGDYRVIVPDHVGCGLSDKPDDSRYPYTLAQRVDDLAALLDHLGISRSVGGSPANVAGEPPTLRERVTLVLHDWGGMIGMAWASRQPERVARLVILNTAAFHLPPGKRLPWSLWLIRNTPLGAVLVRGLNAFSRGAVRYCSVRPLPDAVRDGYLEPYDSWRHRIAVHRFVQDIPLRQGDPSFALVTTVQEGLARFRGVPMLICWGGRDFVFDREYLAEWRRRFPDAEVHEFPEAGHFVLEDAGTEIGPLVREFLGTARQAEAARRI